MAEYGERSSAGKLYYINGTPFAFSTSPPLPPPPLNTSGIRLPTAGQPIALLLAQEFEQSLKHVALEYIALALQLHILAQGHRFILQLALTALN